MIFRKKKQIEVPTLYPMGAFTFAIACSHCKNRHNRCSDKCKQCMNETKSGFELDSTDYKIWNCSRDVL